MISTARRCRSGPPESEHDELASLGSFGGMRSRAPDIMMLVYLLLGFLGRSTRLDPVPPVSETCCGQKAWPTSPVLGPFLLGRPSFAILALPSFALTLYAILRPDALRTFAVDRYYASPDPRLSSALGHIGPPSRMVGSRVAYPDRAGDVAALRGYSVRTRCSRCRDELRW